MKIAIVHDWLVTYAGAERVLEKIIECFPNCDIFSLVDFCEHREFLKNKTAKVSFIQKLPFARTKYRTYLPFMPYAVEQFNLSQYDVIISSSHAVAKGVITGPNQLHICMCYSPIRYAWDLQFQYLFESGLDHGLKGILAKFILHKIRLWDLRTSNGVDKFIAISNYISRRIFKVYRRDSVVIYPPVNINGFLYSEDKKDYYITSSRMVPYKKIDLIVKTFSEKFPEKELIVIGDGPDYKKIKGIAGPNIKLLGFVENEELRRYLAHAKAFVFAAEEDFGIAPLEAQASGTPVIALGKGGALETIEGWEEEKLNATGVFFYEQSIESLEAAIYFFEEKSSCIKSENCLINARRFNEERFISEFKGYVSQEISDWKNNL